MKHSCQRWMKIRDSFWEYVSSAILLWTKNHILFFLHFWHKNKYWLSKGFVKKLLIFDFFWNILNDFVFFSISEHFSPLFSILQKLKTMFFPLEDSSRTRKWTLKSMYLWHANPLFQFFVFFQEIIFQPNIALQRIVEILKNVQYLATVSCEHARFESLRSWKYHVFLVSQPILL